MTVADTPDGRAAVAALVAAWQTCYDMADQERRLKAEAHVLGLPKPLPSNDRMGMRHALEKVVGALEEKDGLLCLLSRVLTLYLCYGLVVDCFCTSSHPAARACMLSHGRKQKTASACFYLSLWRFYWFSGER